MSNETMLKEALRKAVEKLGLNIDCDSIVIERSKDPKHGDYATNLAMKSAGFFKKPPRVIAEEIVKTLDSTSIDKVEIAGPGFINFFLKADSLGSIVETIIAEGSDYGTADPNGTKVDIEYVSANPTGDLHLGHTRGAVIGDAISNLYRKAGYEVTREYYVNDCGNQVRHLGLSLRARYHELFGEPLELGDDDYHGEDLIKLAEKIKELYGDKYLTDNEESRCFFERFGIDEELLKIKKDLKDFGVEFDVFSYESSIRKSGRIERILSSFKEKGYTYEDEGAIYLKTTMFGDDKDRPIVKKDGTYTYFLPDIAYHQDKLERGYGKLINLLGADHHGYIARMKAAVAMLGYDPGVLDIEIYQIVKVYQNGEEVRMSKRTGKAIAHRDLVEMTGKDAVRFIFSEKGAGAHVDFDLDLAVQKSKDNPVYYAQYAHARCASLLELGEEFGIHEGPIALNGPKENAILKHLASFPSMIKGAASLAAPNKVCVYVGKLAQLIHEYYAAQKILDRGDKEGSKERLALIKAAKIVLGESLRLIGVEAPDKM